MAEHEIPVPKVKPPRAGKGRPKGVPNKVSVDVRLAISGAFVQLGGTNWLVAFAQIHPVEFVKLFGKLIPKQVAVTGMPATVLAPAVNLANPTILNAALEYDRAVSAAIGDTGAVGPHGVPDARLGRVPPGDPSGVPEAGDEPAPLPPGTPEGGTAL